jgi:short-subunit dehydrogenase
MQGDSVVIQNSVRKSLRGTAVITGASAGIGALFADRFAKRGYDLILVARRANRLETLAKSLKERYGVAAGWIASDLGNPIELDDLVRTIAADRSITLLVNNAGTSTLGKVAESKPEDLAAMINVNIVALTRLSIAVLPGFKERDRGTIVNIGSVLGLHSLPISSIYSGTKGYVLNFTRGLQDEVAGTGVRVQLVLPAAIATDIWEISGVPLSHLDPSTVMTAEAAVNAILAGFDAGEAITLPSVENPELFASYDKARMQVLTASQTSASASRYSVER